MIQGRAVYRNNVKNLDGKIYKAWFEIDRESLKTKGSYSLNRYVIPNYPFNAVEYLNRFSLKEFDKPNSALLQEIRQGNRISATGINAEGKAIKVEIELKLRYKNANFFTPENKILMREQFLKPIVLVQTNSPKKGKEKTNELDQSPKMCR